ncbi:type VII secretion-associated serine protease mycosin [Mycobacterium sp. G7A2]|uniref:type VII secretion-associated serine protease mycosin n=1 Tax=Mycobacterium sp. G7A2 TaxID=3317307 RepID=UPI0035A828A4
MTALSAPTRVGVVATALALLAVGGAPAGAVAPPQVDPQATPPAGSAGPVEPMAQRSDCTDTGVLPGTDPGAVTASQASLGLPEAWQHSRGDGQLVAVLDTGVTPGPRLPVVEAGGDFVADTDGLTDCDGHGTLVAGLIAGQPGPDGFAGVAPGARLLSIRQSSAHYAPRSLGDDPALAQAVVAVDTLARAVVRAADQGARVITISVATCIPAGADVDQSALGAALRYAAVDKDAVIVAAAGDTSRGMSTGAACDSNPLGDAARPRDPRNWDSATTLSVPSWWQPYVLSVGAVGPGGQATPFTMAGPWVGVAAPGEGITSVSNAEGGGLANGMPDNQKGLAPISGTGYAAAYASGVAALVRSRFPDLSARQVIDRITATAHGAARAPSNLVGAGSIDPVAALTWNVPAAADTDPAAVREIAAPLAPPPPDPTPRIIAFTGAGVLALLVIVTVVMNRKRKDTTP